MYAEPADDPDEAKEPNGGPVELVVVFPRVRVRLGAVYATPGALEAVNWANLSPCELLRRHALGDWGDLDDADWKANDRAAIRGERILSAYLLPNGSKVWLITEADRGHTTLLLPEEY